jgi:hypothetical protein
MTNGGMKENRRENETSGNADSAGNERERFALSRSSRSLPLVPGVPARFSLALRAQSRPAPGRYPPTTD